MATETVGPQTEYITVTVAGQMFGLPIARVSDVFVLGKITAVPLAPEEVAGVLNLRGRIVTVIEMHRRLGLPPRADVRGAMAVGVNANGESYGLVIDAVGDVVKLDDEDREAIPANLDERLACVADGVYRLDDRLLVVLEIERLLDLKPNSALAA